MAIVHMRTYTLQNAALASKYFQRWKPTANSIAKLNVKTRGVYLNETNPKQVLAIIEFRDGDDPAATIEKYASSEAFKEDLGELDMSAFEGVDSVTLEPLDIALGK